MKGHRAHRRGSGDSQVSPTIRISAAGVGNGLRARTGGHCSVPAKPDLWKWKLEFCMTFICHEIELAFAF